VTDYASSAEDVNSVKQLIEDGANVSGAAAGAAIGLVGGPMGVVVGAASGSVIASVLTRVGSEIQRRVTGPREHIRIGAVAGYAGAAIVKRLDRGEQLRNDDFFEKSDDSPSKADEILEGVLLKAGESYQEKKLYYLGELYASIAFDPTINADYANMLITIAGELTYNQYVLLAVGYDNPNPRLKQESYSSAGEATLTLPKSTVNMLTELFRLSQSDLVSDGSVWLGATYINPSTYKTDGAGNALVEMMKLNEIPANDREVVFLALGPA
jgi:hypothetical protein